jgi:uncharacterized membrane-anchored protein YjiN (DUF445 family)
MAQLSVADAAWQQRTADRQGALRRMRIVATGLLVLMLVAFLLCWRFEAALPWLAYPRAFAEAGMVGACADWFAVVALFRHPLGLPIPHTAILPRNKQRIGDMLGVFFAGNFFNSAEVTQRLDRIDVAALLSSWLRNPGNVQLLVQWSEGLLPSALELVGTSQLRGMSRDLIKNGIDSIAAAPLAGRVLAVLVAQGQHSAAYELGLETAIDLLGQSRQTIRQKVTEKTSSWLPAWVDGKLADAFVDGVIETLVAARAADHPWRDEFRAFLDRLIGRLADESELYERCEKIKSEVLDSKLVDDYLAWLTAEIETKLKVDLAIDNGIWLNAVTRVLMTIASWIEENEPVRETINRSARQLVMNTVVPHRDEIGQYVSEVVARWDDETLVQRLELQVGRDLQFIRVNGTLVGGAVGLMLYAITQLLG